MSPAPDAQPPVVGRPGPRLRRHQDRPDRRRRTPRHPPARPDRRPTPTSGGPSSPPAPSSPAANRTPWGDRPSHPGPDGVALAPNIPGWDALPLECARPQFPGRRPHRHRREGRGRVTRTRPAPSRGCDPGPLREPRHRTRRRRRRPRHRPHRPARRSGEIGYNLRARPTTWAAPTASAGGGRQWHRPCAGRPHRSSAGNSPSTWSTSPSPSIPSGSSSAAAWSASGPRCTTRCAPPSTPPCPIRPSSYPPRNRTTRPLLRALALAVEAARPGPKKTR